MGVREFWTRAVRSDMDAPWWQRHLAALSPVMRAVVENEVRDNPLKGARTSYEFICAARRSTAPRSFIASIGHAWAMDLEKGPEEGEVILLNGIQVRVLGVDTATEDSRMWHEVEVGEVEVPEAG